MQVIDPLISPVNSSTESVREGRLEGCRDLIRVPHATVPRRAVPTRAQLTMPQKTLSAKPADVQHGWYIIDADGLVLGRLATRIADALRGKGKTNFTPHVDTGDFVVVINCERIRVTGNKLEQKIYYNHSGYPGGLRERTLQEQLDRNPVEVIRHAVKGMIPKNKLGDAQMRKLKIYAGSDHPHAAQLPQPLP